MWHRLSRNLRFLSGVEIPEHYRPRRSYVRLNPSQSIGCLYSFTVQLWPPIYVYERAINAHWAVYRQLLSSDLACLYPAFNCSMQEDTMTQSVTQIRMTIPCIAIAKNCCSGLRTFASERSSQQNDLRAWRASRFVYTCCHPMIKCTNTYYILSKVYTPLVGCHICVAQSSRHIL